jgi:colanic acid biosynthesis glycosyl transferase WcaI
MRLESPMNAAEASVVPDNPRVTAVREAQSNVEQGPWRRLIFVNRYFYPDVSATSQMLSDLAAGLVGERFERHIVCSRQLYEDARVRLAARDSWKSVAVHRCWSTRFGRARLFGRALDYLSFYVSATLEMLRRCRRGDVIVAMTDPPLISVCASLVARFRGAVLINWLQDVFPEASTALRIRVPAAAWLLRWRNWSLQTARLNVVLGNHMQQRLLALGVPAERVRIVCNWADGTVVTPRPVQRSSLRRTLGAEQQFIVQYSGNLGRVHDYRTLIEAASELQRESGWLFLFIGGGINMQRLQAQAARLGLTNMRFLPYQPRDSLADSLAAADVHLTCLLPEMEGLVVPSKFYGILAAGRPVIVIGDPDGEQARVVRSEACGAVVRSGDGPGLVEALKAARSDGAWLRAAGERARAAFEARYDLRLALTQWRDALTSVAQEAPV